MAIARFAKSFMCSVLWCLVGLAWIASAQQPPAEDTPPRHVWIETPPEPINDWLRHFRVGALVGINIKAEFKMGGDFTVTGSQPGVPGESGRDHLYDDGYVRVDETGNAEGLTSIHPAGMPSSTVTAPPLWSRSLWLTMTPSSFWIPAPRK